MGVGIGPDASLLPVRTVLSSRDDPRRERPPDERRLPPPDPRVALRLTGPRTGTRSTHTHPTCGTGLPPIRRPSSKSHVYSPWNSWNESFDSTDGARLVGDAEHERVAPPDRSGRRRDQFVVRDARLELGDLPLVDAVTERRIDDDRDRGVGMLLHEALDRLAQLGEARHRPTFGGDVGAVDHDVGGPLLGTHLECHFLS